MLPPSTDYVKYVTSSVKKSVKYKQDKKHWLLKRNCLTKMLIYVGFSRVSHIKYELLFLKDNEMYVTVYVMEHGV